MKTRRGDVVLVLFPNSDLRTAKRRPALVLQRDNLGAGLEQTIVAMISSNLARRAHPKPFLKPGAFHLQQVQTISTVKLERRLGVLTTEEMDRVRNALKNRLGI